MKRLIRKADEDKQVEQKRLITKKILNSVKTLLNRIDEASHNLKMYIMLYLIT